jgi:hypothetical protein
MATELVAVNAATGEVATPAPDLDAATIVAKATEVASILAPALRAQNLITRIQGKDYVLVEGWTLLAQMMGHTVGTERTEPVEAGEDRGFVAHAIVKDQHGNVVGSADGYCMRSESAWSRRPAYALAAMAQTRATSRALRQRFGYVIRLAGYEATPAEEMPHQEAHAREATVTDAQRRGLVDAAAENGLSPKEAGQIINDLTGATSSAEIPARKYDEVVQAFATAGATKANADADHAAALVRDELGGEVVDAA